MAEILITELTEGTVTGNGIFDKLMQVTKAHLQEEYNKNRIKGPEYATLYLGALQNTLQQAMQFLLTKQEADLKAQLMAGQLAALDKELLLSEQKILLAQEEVKLATAKLANVDKEGALLDAQAANTRQQTINLQAEKCKLDAEFDLIKEQTLKVGSERDLLGQKLATEKAQTLTSWAEEGSTMGRQRALYAAQTAGFSRDAEQKAADILIKTWQVRRTTDEGTAANTENKLHDQYIGQAVNKLLSGIGA